MGRLFWKFFFSYWAALLLAILGVAAAGWLSRVAEEDLELSLEAGPRATVILSAAEATLRHGGLPALRELLARWGGQADVLLYVVDDDDRELLGREIPPGALERARQLVETGAPAAEARRVQALKGGSYLLFIPSAATPLLLRTLFGGPIPAPMVPLVLGVVASIVFGAVIAWYVARPIRHLRGAFESLAQGRLEARVGPLIGRRRDEVADLGRDFDAMAQRLQKLIAAQRALLHDVSHELRSPLARLHAAIGLVRQNPRRLESSLGRIEREAERLDELVGQLLTLSRLEAGMSDDAADRSEALDLVDLAASIASDAHFEAQASGRSVSFEGAGELLVSGRGELLHRAVENVVRNAIRFTDEGTTVEVSVAASRSSREAIVTVADRGPGVAPDELQAIFEPFRRGAGAAGGGVGLGLAIARRAVEAHGGRVHASNRPDRGLAIELRLPL